jgi:hypothetical protein
LATAKSSQGSVLVRPEVKRRPDGTFAPGQSGCPDSHLRKQERLRQAKAIEAELLRAIVADCGGKKALTALELILAQQAASELARARFEKNPSLRVRLTRSATALIDRLRNGVAKRAQPHSLGAFRI